MKYFIIENDNEDKRKRTIETRTYSFEKYGEEFIAHRNLQCPDWWNVTHAGTGMAVTKAHKTKKQSIEEANKILSAVGKKKLREAVKKAKHYLTTLV